MNSYSYNTPPGHPGAYYPSFGTTPSPAGPPSGGHHGCYARPGPSPRYDSRHPSSGDTYGYSSPRGTTFSPRYNSSGYYATATNVSGKQNSYTAPRRSYSYHRVSHGDSDEGVFEYVDYIVDGGHAYNKDNFETTPVYEQPQPSSRRRRQSSSTPQRPTARPTSSTPNKSPPVSKANEADARKHRIPPGYSLKNWDPAEEPIMLLGSVFDANSLGKWIYDWTVYHHGPATPIADMAGELWLLLIQLAGKVKRAEECMGRIRTKENKEMVDDFIDSGERLTNKLKTLLKSCETPMLKAGNKYGKDSAKLGKNAGSEFVDTIFGPDRQLEATEKFMSSIRLWNVRFDANCEDILKRPGQ
ncbi:hypothetical protein DL95DRAFT_500675 [Leptodontidium sp. 2 PMI_412]|nr:hypothetical protein DL95DRAFT_500675 [Leptodontidium sp. 2 PMI_412]